VVHRKNENDSRVLALPKGDALRGNLMLSLAFAAYFWIVYGTGDFVAAHAAERFHVALPFEQSIPFVPWAAVIYLTVTPLFCLAPFIFRTPERLLPLFVTMCVEVTIAGVIFCLFPVELRSPRTRSRVRQVSFTVWPAMSRSPTIASPRCTSRSRSPAASPMRRSAAGRGASSSGAGWRRSLRRPCWPTSTIWPISRLAHC
jgi:hypothetical protein